MRAAFLQALAFLSQQSPGLDASSFTFAKPVPGDDDNSLAMLS